jgi:YesN/AraC family two-component response regulator
MNTAEKINYIKTETTSSFSWRYLVLNTSFFIYSVTYLIYILHLLNKQVKRSNETLLETKKEIKWVKILATCLLSIQVIALFLLLSSDKEKKFNYLPGFLIITLAVLIIKWVLEPDALKSLIKSKPKNPVKVSDIEKHALRLEELMKKEKPYINKELTIKMLAEMLSLPGYQLSIIINNYFNKSFFDYVNNYRVEYAKEKLLDKNFDHYKVDVIGEEVGFKSRSTFFASFKKQTSMAPIEFRKKTKSLNN